MYRAKPCVHCTTRSGEQICADCEQRTCEACGLDGRCPGCFGTQLRRSRRRARWAAAVGLALGLAGVAAAGVTWAMRAEAAIPVTRQVSQDHVYAVQGAIADYVVLERRCPDVLEGLVNRGLLEHYQLTDDWGQPISFRCWSNAPHLSVMVWSPGPDGRDSTPDDVRDHRFIRHVLDRN